MRDRSYRLDPRALLASIAFALVIVMTLGAAVAAEASPQMATVTILHGLPGFTADVYVNGKLTLDGFEPETATPALRLPAGGYDIAIRNVGSSPQTQPVLHARVSLDGGIDYTIVAHLSGSGDPEVTVFRNGVGRVPVGRSRLIVRNVAETSPLTIRLDSRPRFPDLASAEAATASVAPGRYSIDVVDEGSASQVIPATRIALREGVETIVYVVGASADNSLDLMSQVVGGLSSNPASVPSGDGGLAASGQIPPWPIVLTALGIWSIAWGAERAFRRRRPHAGRGSRLVG